MAKAILVIDMPKSCDVCDFVRESRACNGDLYCNNPFSKQYGEYVNDYILCRAEGCPLRELPDKKEISHFCETSTDWQKGYNTCLDDILRDSEV